MPAICPPDNPLPWEAAALADGIELALFVGKSGGIVLLGESLTPGQRCVVLEASQHASVELGELAAQ